MLGVSCQHHEHRQELNENIVMWLTCHIARDVDSVAWRGRLGRRRLTKTGDRDGDRPRVSGDNGNLSGDSAPLLIAKKTHALAWFFLQLSR